jgi:hypothetical protein
MERGKEKDFDSIPPDDTISLIMPSIGEQDLHI